MSPAPAPAAVQRWAPWLIGAVVAVVYGAIGPHGVTAEAPPVWGVLARLAAVIPIGDAADRAQLLAAVCAGGAAAILARLAIGFGGGDAAAIAGAAAAAAVLASAGPWAHAAGGPVALASALALGTIALVDRVAAGGGAWPGVTAGVLGGLAIAMDRAAVAIVPVVVVLLAIRLWHGARWVVFAPLAGAVAWVLAMIPVWRGAASSASPASPVRIDGARYAIGLVDAVGAIAAVAAVVGVVALIARPTTRWSGAVVAAAIAGGIAIDRAGGHAAGAMPLLGLSLAAGLGVARLARHAGPPVGQACLGAAAALIVAVPAALAAAL